MIADLDRYQGAVIRQLLVVSAKALHLGAVSTSGRVDAFFVEQGAFQVKHSSKRLSPWQFTYMEENLQELAQLEASYSPVWVLLVCGQDGIVGLSLEELRTVIRTNEQGDASIRVKRGKNSMYRVSGASGELSRAKPKGVDEFISKVLRLSEERQ